MHIKNQYEDTFEPCPYPFCATNTTVPWKHIKEKRKKIPARVHFEKNCSFHLWKVTNSKLYGNSGRGLFSQCFKILTAQKVSVSQTHTGHRKWLVIYSSLFKPLTSSVVAKRKIGILIWKLHYTLCEMLFTKTSSAQYYISYNTSKKFHQVSTPWTEKCQQYISYYI
jgi:hypothetical protein